MLFSQIDIFECLSLFEMRNWGSRANGIIKFDLTTKIKLIQRRSEL